MSHIFRWFGTGQPVPLKVGLGAGREVGPGARRELALDLGRERDGQHGVVEDHRELGVLAPVARPGVRVRAQVEHDA